MRVGVCGSVEEPCTTTETCDEGNDTCIAPELDEGITPDALVEIQPPEDEGCCQTNAPVTVLVVPALFGVLGLRCRRRRRRTR